MTQAKFFSKQQQRASLDSLLKRRSVDALAAADEVVQACGSTLTKVASVLQEKVHLVGEDILFCFGRKGFP